MLSKKPKDKRRPTIVEIGYVLEMPQRLIGTITKAEPTVSRVSGTPFIKCDVSFSELDTACIYFHRFLLTRWADAGFVSRDWNEDDLVIWLTNKQFEFRMKSVEHEGKPYIQFDPIRPVFQ